MNENRRQILEMLAQGKITADEAERLIAALEKVPGSEAPRSDAKYLRVLVEADKDNGGTEPTKVNIRVPMKLLRAGVKLAGLLPQEAREHVNDAMREKGLNFDLNQLKPENLDELIDNLQDLSVDVEEKDKRTKVKVFCE
jgi:polyhydroxyalkanoate synthesis regulator phasin